MGIERRLEEKRMDVNRHMEVACLESGLSFSGECKNVSDGGLKATLDGIPEIGSSVLIKLYWDDLVTPAESFGKVAWCEPFEGDTFEAGFMIGAESNPVMQHRQNAQTADNLPAPELKSAPRPAPKRKPRRKTDDIALETRQTVASLDILSRLQAREIVNLTQGQTFRVRHLGEDGSAAIENIGTINPNGTLTLTIKLKDKAMVQAALEKSDEAEGNSDAIDYVSWQKSPLQVAYEKSFPVLQAVARYSVKLARVARQTGRFLWEKTPQSLKVKTAATASRIQLLLQRRHK